MTVRSAMIDILLPELARVLGTTHAPINDAELRSLYAAGEYRAMLREMRDQMRLQLRIAVRYAASENQPRESIRFWIPSNLPFYGMQSYADSVVRMSFVPHYLAEATFEIAVSILGIVLSRILLKVLRNEHSDSYEAAAIAALILGYGPYFRIAAQRVEGRAQTALLEEPGDINRVFGEMLRDLKQANDAELLYLNKEEIVYAIQRIETFS